MLKYRRRKKKTGRCYIKEAFNKKETLQERHTENWKEERGAVSCYIKEIGLFNKKETFQERTVESWKEETVTVTCYIKKECDVTRTKCWKTEKETLRCYIKEFGRVDVFWRGKFLCGKECSRKQEVSLVLLLIWADQL